MFLKVCVLTLKSFPYSTRRFVTTTLPCMNSNKYQSREAKMLNKLMGSSKKKRKNYICETPTTAAGELKLGKEIQSSKENSRRIAVLNKLFIKNISDLIATGSFSETVLDKGLEITKVAVAQNFKQVNVFWTTNNEKNLEALEAIVPNLGFYVRHELSQMQVMGVVPRVVFVKDIYYVNALKVDALLGIADFGDDYVPYRMGTDFSSTQELECNSKLLQKNEEDSEQAVEVMPPMRQDTFNLDHSRIMEKIMKSMKKTRALHRFEPNLALEGDGTESTQVTSDSMSKEERKEALSRFILERKLQKQSKYSDKYNSELKGPIYIYEDVEQDDDYEDFSEEDYIDEDEDEQYNIKRV